MATTRLHIYYGERPVPLRGDYVSMHSCHYTAVNLIMPVQLQHVKECVVQLWQMNPSSCDVILEGVRPILLADKNVYVHKLCDLHSEGAWRAYVRKAIERNFELAVFAACMRRSNDDEAGPSRAGNVDLDDVIVGMQQAHIGQDHTIDEEVEAEPMDEEVHAEAGGEEVHTEGIAEEIDVEAMADPEDEVGAEDDDDPSPAIKFFRLLGTLNSNIAEYEQLSRCGYADSDIQIGQTFRNKEEVVHFIGTFAVNTRREHYVKRTEPTGYEVQCVREGTCPFYVRAHKPKGERHFIIVRYTPHTCTEAGVRNVNRLVDAKYVAQTVLHLVQDDVELKPRTIMSAVQSSTGMEVDYRTAWRARRKAIQMLFGTFEESYNWAPRLLQKISMTNPGTEWAIDQECITTQDGTMDWDNRILNRLFWSFGQCIQAFTYCAPVLCVDGTFLTGKYHRVLLTALAADANNQILPLAFAIVDAETYDSWLWFLSAVKEKVVRDRPRVCLVSDRNAGLLSALEDMKSGQAQTAWHDLETRWCMRHLGANFYSMCKSKKLVKKFKIMCLQNQLRKFQALWNDIQQSTVKLVAEEEAQGQGLPDAHGQGGPIVRRGMVTLAQWMAQKPAARWALAHDTEGARYDNSERLNQIL